MKVIYHVDEMERWPLTLGNVRNMAAYYREHGESFVIEVLANAAAVKAYCGGSANAACGTTDLMDDMSGLSEGGIVFTACSNALKANSIKPDQLYPFVKVVPAGVVELAERQAEGYAYIRP